ncbi:MAG: glycine zipper 2TM domain-containing protein [Dokdonella sp.]
MINKTILAVLATLSLAACATGPGYYGGDYRSQSDRNYYNQRGCNTCGEVTSVQRTYLREGTSGGGAVLGAIVGGVLGNTVGRGDGRQAATVAGAVAGGFAGNAIERNQGQGGHEGYLIEIRLDDGRYAQVTQERTNGLRRGDRVVIRNNRAQPLNY